MAFGRVAIWITGGACRRSYSTPYHPAGGHAYPVIALHHRRGSCGVLHRLATRGMARASRTAPALPPPRPTNGHATARPTLLNADAVEG